MHVRERQGRRMDHLGKHNVFISSSSRALEMWKKLHGTRGSFNEHESAKKHFSFKPLVFAGVRRKLKKEPIFLSDEPLFYSVKLNLYVFMYIYICICYTTAPSSICIESHPLLASEMHEVGFSVVERINNNLQNVV